jgi:hypothetical protein
MRPAAIGGPDGDAPAPGVLKVTEQFDETNSSPPLKGTWTDTFIVAPTVGSTTPFTIRLELALPVALAWEICRSMRYEGPCGWTEQLIMTADAPLVTRVGCADEVPGWPTSMTVVSNG